MDRNADMPALPLGNRRAFLRDAVIGTGAVLGAGLWRGPVMAAEPIERVGGAHMKLSLAAYSFSRYLPRNWTSPEQLAQAQMTLEDFIRFCAELDLDGTELTGYYFPKQVTPEYLISLKNLAFRQGLDISGTAIGNDFCLPEGEQRQAQLQMTRDWIDYAAVMGAPVIRIFAGRVPPGETEETALERCVAGIDESLEYAATKGVFLALENHGGITATPEQMLRITRAVRPSPWFGVNLDSGNFHTADPYGDLEKIAPHAINVQIKVALLIDGKKQEADLERVIAILRDAGYRGYVALEYEEREEPREAIPPYVRQLRKLIRG